jgi:hypothetical protein
MLQEHSQSPLRFQLSTDTPKGDRCNPLEFGEQVMPEYRIYTVDYPPSPQRAKHTCELWQAIMKLEPATRRSFSCAYTC